MKLSPFLQAHFLADSKEDVRPDIWEGAITSMRRVLDHPERFPRADFEYLHRLEHELLAHQI